MKNMFLFIRFATSKRMGCDGDVLIFEIFFFILVWKKSSLMGRKADQEGRLDAEQQSDRDQTNFTGLRVD